MLVKLAVIGFVGLVLAAAEHFEKEIHVTVGQEVINEIQSLRYPSPGRQGNRQTWHLTADPGHSVQLICDELTIGPSEGCVNAFLEIDDGAQTTKYCGREPSMTFVSKDNKMTVVFELIRQSGILQCGATAVKVQPTVEYPEEGKIHLPLGVAYEKIFEMKRDANIKKRSWQFTTDDGIKLSVKCFLALTNDSCMTINEEKLCGKYGVITKLSNSNSMDIEVENIIGDKNGVDCLVQAVNGPGIEHFKNIVSTEVDSSEFGVAPGAKQTSCKCGWSNKKASRIINGKEAGQGEFPWMVALKTEQGQFCGGSIISEYHVLTAAHCTIGRKMSDMTVVVGSVNLRNGGEEYTIKLIREQRYQKLDLHRNDIAIITLDRPIKFSKDVGPVCLTQFTPDIDNEYVTVMGWGYLNTVNWERPNILRKTQIRVVDQKSCAFQWQRKLGPEKDRMCTWSSSRDACMGDSGSPVVWLDPETNRYTQIGLVSFGRGCNGDVPSVNTFVPYYYKWFQKEMNLYPAGTKSCRKLG